MTKILPKRSGELSGAICLRALILLGNDPVSPSNCSENSLGLFVRFLKLCESLSAPEISAKETLEFFDKIKAGELHFK